MNAAADWKSGWPSSTIRETLPDTVIGMFGFTSV